MLHELLLALNGHHGQIFAMQNDRIKVGIIEATGFLVPAVLTPRIQPGPQVTVYFILIR